MAGQTAGWRTLLILASLALVVAGSWVAYAEAHSHLVAGVLDNERVSALAANRVTPGPSISSKRAVLESCIRAMRAAGALGQPSSRLTAVSTNCLAIADRLTAAMPADSYGWFVAALASYWLGDREGAAARLVRAQETGPNEQWIAEMRAGLGEALLDALPPDGLSNHDDDLRMLVASQRGIRSIAGRYVEDANFRDRITAIVESMPQDDQRRFVQAIRIETDRLQVP